MSNRYGRSKGELKFYVVVSILGFALIAFALFYRGLPKTIIGWEMFGIGGAFFGATLFWAVRKLWRGDYPDEP